jgi:hypothetical protein
MSRRLQTGVAWALTAGRRSRAGGRVEPSRRVACRECAARGSAMKRTFAAVLVGCLLVQSARSAIAANHPRRSM